MEKAMARHHVFAPPFLVHGKVVVAQTANILFYLGPRLRLAPKGETARLWLHQQQLTIADWVVEVHDVHHPIGSGLYYEDQKPEAKRRAADFLANRAPKFLGYFERVAKTNKPGKGRFMVGARLSHVDLSLFQIVEGLRYAFPKAMAKLEKKAPRVVAVHDAVAELPRIRAYVDSPRRIPFNEMGIFRHYPELDSD